MAPHLSTAEACTNPDPRRQPELDAPTAAGRYLGRGAAQARALDAGGAVETVAGHPAAASAAAGRPRARCTRDGAFLQSPSPTGIGSGWTRWGACWCSASWPAARGRPPRGGVSGLQAGALLDAPATLASRPRAPTDHRPRRLGGRPRHRPGSGHGQARPVAPRDHVLRITAEGPEVVTATCPSARGCRTRTGTTTCCPSWSSTAATATARGGHPAQHRRSVAHQHRPHPRRGGLPGHAPGRPLPERRRARPHPRLAGRKLPMIPLAVALAALTKASVPAQADDLAPSCPEPGRWPTPARSASTSGASASPRGPTPSSRPAGLTTRPWTAGCPRTPSRTRGAAPQEPLPQQRRVQHRPCALARLRQFGFGVWYSYFGADHRGASMTNYRTTTPTSTR